MPPDPLNLPGRPYRMGIRGAILEPPSPLPQPCKHNLLLKTRGTSHLDSQCQGPPRFGKPTPWTSFPPAGTRQVSTECRLKQGGAGATGTYLGWLNWWGGCCGCSQAELPSSRRISARFSPETRPWCRSACRRAGPHTPRHRLAAAAAKPMFASARLEFTLRSAPHPQDGADTCSF